MALEVQWSQDITNSIELKRLYHSHVASCFSIWMILSHLHAWANSSDTLAFKASVPHTTIPLGPKLGKAAITYYWE